MDLIAYPKITDIQSALFIQPHPDDNEIGAGGTMAWLVRNKIPVYGLTVTLGAGGSKTIPPSQLAAMRKIEAGNAMNILGVINLGDLGYQTLNYSTHDDLVGDLVKVIRKIRPQAIFTADPALQDEMHPVHLHCGKAVNEAFMRSPEAWYPFSDDKLHEDAWAPEIIGYYFTDRANTAVDIADVYELKMKAIRAHKTQVDEATMAMYDKLFKLQSGAGPVVERLRLLNRIHAHCFAIPDFLK